MNLNNCEGGLENQGILLTSGLGYMGGIAVGQLRSGVRYLYYCAGVTGQSPGARASIWKSNISLTGISTPIKIYEAPNSNFDFETSELDLSPDGTMLAFATNGETFGLTSPSTPRYYIVNLNASGDWDGNAIKTFDITVNPDVNYGSRGVEFYHDNTGVTKLMIGAGTIGIYRIDPLNPLIGQTFIPGTGNYGYSQIELAPNGFLYASNSANTIAIDVSGNIPSLQPSSNITTPSTSYIDHGFAPPPRFYTLPDQIDGEDLNPYIISACNRIDLFIRDNDVIPGHYDTGEEPNPDQGEMWISKDIYVHQTNANPNVQSDEPIADGSTAYVYVLIHNRSCLPYTSDVINDKVHLYYSKASTALDWDDFWVYDINGPRVCSNIVPGEELSTSPKSIPNIPPGGQAWVEFEWAVPAAAPFSCFGTEWLHFCLLARLEAPSISDNIGPEGSFLYTNVQNYNNIAWKNITLVNISPFSAGDGACINDKEIGGTVGVGNSTNENDVFRLDFKVDENYVGTPIFEQAEIKVTLDAITWQKWADGGFAQENFRVKREDCRQLVVLGSPATLKNLSYNAKEISTIALSFNFLTEHVENTPYFDYHVIESFDNEQKTILGGELYRIQKPSRSLFGADGGENKQIAYEDSVELSAASIGESAYYNWYNEAGELIYSGQDFTVSPEITSKYNLEVIAQSDGFTSHASVIVHVKEYEIKELSPNPAVDQLTISYQAKKASSAYLSIIQPYNNLSNNYILDPTITENVINVSSYTPGSYFVRLICDGVVRDEKTLIVQ